MWINNRLVSQTCKDYYNGVVVGSNTAKFIYDGIGELLGFTLNDTRTFLYSKNTRGDITAIVDDRGNKVISYYYDVWGKVTSDTTPGPLATLAAKLEKIS